MGREEHDTEGRLITAEYPSLYLVNAYIPNSGDGLKRLDYRIQQWDGHLAEYLQSLAKQKPVVLTGDLNCSHQEIDIHAPKRNLRSAGFTQASSQPHMVKLQKRDAVIVSVLHKTCCYVQLD